MNYLYRQVEDAPFSQNTPERRAFAKHLKLVALALHDIEWVDSCDYGIGDENAAINLCLPDGAIVKQCLEDAKAAAQCLITAIERQVTK